MADCREYISELANGKKVEISLPLMFRVVVGNLNGESAVEN